MRHKFFGKRSIISIMDQWGPSGPFTRPLEVVLNIILMPMLIQNKQFLVVSTTAEDTTECIQKSTHRHPVRLQ